MPNTAARVYELDLEVAEKMLNFDEPTGDTKSLADMEVRGKPSNCTGGNKRVESLKVGQGY